MAVSFPTAHEALQSPCNPFSPFLLHCGSFGLQRTPEGLSFNVWLLMKDGDLCYPQTCFMQPLNQRFLLRRPCSGVLVSIQPERAFLLYGGPCEAYIFLSWASREFSACAWPLHFSVHARKDFFSSVACAWPILLSSPGREALYHWISNSRHARRHP
eukprot:Gb_27886 [translate_table: standard]